MPEADQLTEAQRRELERARRAIDAIDTGAKRDFEHVRPGEHAKGLPSEAAPLRRIIESDGVAPIVERQRQAAYGATRAQARQRVLFHLALLPAGFAMAAALLVTTAHIGLDEKQKWLIDMLVWACFALACLVTLYSVVMSVGAWRKASRETRETLRRDVFTAILGAEQSASGSEIAPYLLQLEYFRRFQLKAQIDYYATRIGEQGARRDRTAIWKWLGLLLFVLLCVVIGLISFGALGEQGYLTSPGVAWLAALVHRLEANSIDTWLLTALLGCIAVYLFSLLSAIQIGDHRSLYGDALSRLLAVQGAELEPSRTAAAGGDPGPMRRMAAHVHEIMEREHRIWLGR